MARKLATTVASPFQLNWGTSAVMTGIGVSLGTMILLGLILSGARAIALLPVLMALTIVLLGALFTRSRFTAAKKFDVRVDDFKRSSRLWMWGFVGAAVTTMVAGFILAAIGFNAPLPSQATFWFSLLGGSSYAACIAVLGYSPRGGLGKAVVIAALAIGAQFMTFALAAQQAWLDAGHFMN